jgi:hypothetical protein
VYEWVAGWKDGWMDGWMDLSIDRVRILRDMMIIMKLEISRGSTVVEFVADNTVVGRCCRCTVGIPALVL